MGEAITTEPIIDPKPTEQDHDGIFNKGYARGIDKGSKDGYLKGQTEYKTILSDIFGTDNIDEIKKIKTSSAGSPDIETIQQQYLSEIKSLQSQVSEMGTKLTQAEQQKSIESLRSQITAKVGEFKPVDAVSQRILVDEILKQYDIKENIIVKKGTDLPVFIANKEATIESLLSSMKSGEYQRFFEAQGNVTHPKTGDHTNNGSYMPTREDMLNPKFVQALRDSGQYKTALDLQPINFDAVKKYMS